MQGLKKNWVIKAPTGLEPVPPGRTLLPTKLRSHNSQFFSASIFLNFFNLYILIWKLKLFRYSFIPRTETWLISGCDFWNNFCCIAFKVPYLLTYHRETITFLQRVELVPVLARWIEFLCKKIRKVSTVQGLLEILLTIYIALLPLLKER